MQDYIASSSGDIYRDGQLRLIAEKDGVTVGCIDLFDLDIRNRRAALGMYVAKGSRGQGIGREMVEELEKYAFSFLRLRVLYAVIAVRNTPCRQLYQSLGYEPSSVLSHWTLEDDAQLWLKVRTDSQC